MTSNTSHPIRLHCLQVTFSNDLVSRSKRPIEETEKGNQPGSKRRCSSSPRLSSSNSGLAPSAKVHLLPTSTSCDDSDVDDSLLEPSYGEELDSPTGLSREAEDDLLAEDLIDELETSSRAVDTYRVRGVRLLVNLTQPPRVPEEGQKSIHPEPLRPDGPSACKKTSVCPESEDHPNKGSQNQAGLGLGSKGPLLLEPVSVNLKKGNNVPGVIERGTAQSRRETSAEGERPLAGQASIDQKGPGGDSTGNLLGYTGGELDSADTQRKAARSASSSVGDQRENHVRDLHSREPKRPRRIYIQETDLESSKEKYINAVLNHARCREPVIGEVNEMLRLMQKVASEYQGYNSQHTTDLTVRNYAQRSKSTARTFSLSQWVDWNGRSVRRFESIPESFQRSPIPS